MKISPTILRALRILRDHDGLFPSDFSRRMWDTSSWERHTLGMTGGSYLDRLRQGGFLEEHGIARLSELGHEALELADLDAFADEVSTRVSTTRPDTRSMDREKSPHTGQHEPVQHTDGRFGMIWEYLAKDAEGDLSIKWKDGTISVVKWEDLEG